MSLAPRTGTPDRTGRLAALAGAAALVAVFAAAPARSAGTADAVSHDPPPGTRTESSTPARTNAGAPAFKVKITNNNLIGVTVTNYGFYGNNFVSRSPSFEYPLGAGFEHMVRGGLWIGGITDYNDAMPHATLVTTGAVDGTQGTASASATEFTPGGNTIVERSRLENNKFFSLQAVSEQDFVMDYNDFPAKPTVTGGQDHFPLGVSVHQETYNWSFSRFKNFVALHLQIKNAGRTLDSLYVGLYTELASGNKNGYSSWPPSSSGGGTLGGWFSKKLLKYDVPSRVLGEHYCASFGSGESSCMFEIVPPWVGIQLLGVRPDTVANKRVTSFIANYAPGDTTRDEDRERYALMSTGRITPADSLLPGFAAEGRANDPTNFLAVGPFNQLAPDSMITVDFAFVGGDSYADLLENAKFAQLAFNFDYVIPTPPPSPRLTVVPADGALDLYWDSSPEQTVDRTSPAPGGKDFEGYRVYLGRTAGMLTQVAQFDEPDTAGFNTGFSAIALPDSQFVNGIWCHYKYRISGLKTGFRYFVSVTSFDTGDQQIESLESGLTQNQLLTVPAPSTAEAAGRNVTVFPNPYRAEAAWDAGRLVRDHYLWFANLPRRCKIQIFSLAGDQVKAYDFDGDTYRGQGTRGLYNSATEIGVSAPELSGTVFAWNLISDRGQAVASGLYLYSVKDSETGKVQRGKFLVVKSDKETFE
ncbi:MAG: hypothetical protein ABI960_02070 [Candidatus Eisenbacteria bacterium]